MYKFCLFVLFFTVCTCNSRGAIDNDCDPKNGKCSCQNEKIGGEQCERCVEGYYNYPTCDGKNVLTCYAHNRHRNLQVHF